MSSMSVSSLRLYFVLANNAIQFGQCYFFECYFEMARSDCTQSIETSGPMIPDNA